MKDYLVVYLDGDRTMVSAEGWMSRDTHFDFFVSDGETYRVIRAVMKSVIREIVESVT